MESSSKAAVSFNTDLVGVTVCLCVHVVTCSGSDRVGGSDEEIRSADRHRRPGGHLSHSLLLLDPPCHWPGGDRPPATRLS